MKVELTYKVGYADVDAHRAIRPRVLARLFQDAATIHSDKAGFGFSTLMARNKAWVLYQMGIHLHRIPAVDEHIRIQSWHSREDRLMAFRDYLVTCNDETLVTARGVWLMLDMRQSKPLLLASENVSERYTLEPPIPDAAAFDAWTPSLMLALTHTCPIVLRPSDFDSLGHVNNALYFDFLDILIHQTFGNNVNFKSLYMQYSKQIPTGTKQIQAGLQQHEDRYRFKLFSGKVLHAVGDFQVA